MKNGLTLTFGIFLLFLTFSCQKDYSCKCETINYLYNPEGGMEEVQNIQAKNKETAKTECESRSEEWGDVVTTCTLQ